MRSEKHFNIRSEIPYPLRLIKNSNHLQDHIATHTGQKTHRCSFCDEAFIWRPNMYSHQKKAHPEEWNAKKKQRNRPTQAQDDRNK